MSIARARAVVGSLYALMRNRLGLNVATALEAQELSATVAPGRRLVVLGHEPIAGFARDHGTVADEAAMLALHTLDSSTLLAEPRFVAPGDSCLRFDDPGWRWHCIAGHGQSLSEWERRPLTAAITAVAAGAGTATWGGISGEIANQEDLAAALDAKLALADALPAPSSVGASGVSLIASGPDNQFRKLVAGDGVSLALTEDGLGVVVSASAVATALVLQWLSFDDHAGVASGVVESVSTGQSWAGDGVSAAVTPWVAEDFSGIASGPVDATTGGVDWAAAGVAENYT